MSLKKTGIVFLTLIVVLAGIGGAFAAWTDTLLINGTVETGSVKLEVTDYSGTEAWKVYPHDIEVIRGWQDAVEDQRPKDDKGELVASAWAQPGDGEKADVVFQFDNLFPGEVFCADVLVHYTGSIPAKVNLHITGDDWLKKLLIEGDAWVSMYWYDEENNDYGEKIPLNHWPVQMHPDEFEDGKNYIIVVVCVAIPQDNDLMNKEGSFTGKITAVQWNVCIEEPPVAPDLGGTIGFWGNWDRHNTYEAESIKAWLANIDAESCWLGPTTTEDMVSVLSPPFADMKANFLAQYLATRLNVESGRLQLETVWDLTVPFGGEDIYPLEGLNANYLNLVDPAAATLAEIINLDGIGDFGIESKCDTYPTDDQFEIMKDIADALNNLWV